MEKQRLNSYWPSDDNDDTDEDLQKDPPEALIDDNYPHKTYTYVSFKYQQTPQQHPSTPIFEFHIFNEQQISTHLQLHRRPTVAHLHSSADPSSSIFQSSIVTHMLSQR